MVAVAGCKSGAGIQDVRRASWWSHASHGRDRQGDLQLGRVEINVDFGSVPITQRRVETLSLSNVGSSDMTILKVSQDTADAEFSVDVTQGQVLVAGGTAVPIPVHFVPFTTGPRRRRSR